MVLSVQVAGLAPTMTATGAPTRMAPRDWAVSALLHASLRDNITIAAPMADDEDVLPGNARSSASFATLEGAFSGRNVVWSVAPEPARLGAIVAKREGGHLGRKVGAAHAQDVVTTAQTTHTAWT